MNFSQLIEFKSKRSITNMDLLGNGEEYSIKREENTNEKTFKIVKVEKKKEEISQNPFDKLKGVADQKSIINSISTNYLSNTNSPFLGSNIFELNQNQIFLPNTIYSKNLNSIDPQKNNIINIICICGNEEINNKNKIISASSSNEKTFITAHKYSKYK